MGVAHCTQTKGPFMAGLEDILKMLPIDDIAAKLGVDPATAQQAVNEGGATILGGLQKNAATNDGAAAIQAALKKHAGPGASSLDEVDQADGQKILTHIFGGEKENVEKALTQDKATAGIDFGKLLPMLAPIIMGMLAKGNTAQQAQPESSGGGISDLLGGLLGGLGGGGNQQSGGGLDLGGLLNGLGGLFGKK